MEEAQKLIIWLLGVSIYLTANPHTHARIQPLFQSIGIFIGVEQQIDEYLIGKTECIAHFDDDGALCALSLPFCFGLFGSHPMSCLIRFNCIFFGHELKKKTKKKLKKEFNSSLAMRNYWFAAN